MAIPKFQAVPSTIQNPCNRKATLTGVTYLKQGKYSSRYTGSKHYQVDINGNLRTAAELRKLIRDAKGPQPARRKKNEAPVETGAGTNSKNNFVNDAQISCILPENQQVETNNHAGLPESGNDVRKKEYSIKKQAVRHRILNYINTQAGKKQLFFFTVTFPKNTPDNTAYQIYNIWLTSLRKYGMLKNYLWVAERQPQTGTIHFHIAVPHFMNVIRANAMMAGTLKTFARRGEIPFSVHACKKYNGVDIAKHKNTGRVINFAIKKGGRALGNYLTKYVTKNDEKFSHLAWHNSRGFSAVFTGVTFNKDEFLKTGIFKLLDFTKKFEGEFSVFIPWRHGPPAKLLQHLYERNSFIQSLINKNENVN